jgi:hypothetical protein
MKITALARSRQILDHIVVDSDPSIIGREENGNLFVSVPTRPITLAHGTDYTLFISLDPKEIYAFNRASMTLPVPVPVKEPTFKRRRLS